MAVLKYKLELAGYEGRSIEDALASIEARFAEHNERIKALARERVRLAQELQEPLVQVISTAYADGDDVADGDGDDVERDH